MCDHTNDPGGREAAMVVLDPGTPERHGRKAWREEAGRDHVR